MIPVGTLLVSNVGLFTNSSFGFVKQTIASVYITNACRRSFRANGDSNIALCRHGGGGAGETGDGHCRGGCHGYEALENLVHCSPFLICLKSWKSSVMCIQLLPSGHWVATLRSSPPSPRRVHHCRLLRLKARPATAIATARNPAAYILFTPSPPVPGRTTPGVLVMEPPSTVNAANF